MKLVRSSLVLLIFKLIVLSLFMSPFLESAMALDELFETYSAPQALGMGNALTANAKGHIANYYNPAGLAKEIKRRWEYIIIAIDGIPSLSGLSTMVSAKSLGIYRLFNTVQQNPGRYSYFRFNFMPAISRRNFAATFLSSYWYAAQSDGTNVDINAGVDVGPSIGYAMNFAGNLIKLGVSAKAIIRNQLKGIYAHSDMTSDQSIAGMMKEGIGFGANIGLMMTLPNKYLPTLGIAVKDVFNTSFSHTNILNNRATGTPDSIERSINAAFSIRPQFSFRLKTLIAFEIKHLEMWDLPLRKRMHLGVQLEDGRSLYFWGGLNQLYITLGMGLRVTGGNLEVGTYSQDIGQGNDTDESRRFFFRYTISF